VNPRFTGRKNAVVCAAIGATSLGLLDFVFAPAAMRAPAPAPVVAVAAEAAAAPMPSVRVVIPAAARVPTIVARFDSEQKEPSDQTAIRALATAMIEDHQTAIVLEGHSDVRGADDYNQQISLARAEWVKSRLVALGVSPDRIETVGLGATRPLRPNDPDAQAINRRVEVRWVGR
jgi:outer membrane protein OmpA-like peptidoglycan-associated protein